jgi:heme exporter protein CcmD
MLNMHWNSLADFLAMGNHGLYVWGSVAVMALLMLAEPILLLQGRKKLDRPPQAPVPCRANRSPAQQRQSSRRSKD